MDRKRVIRGIFISLFINVGLPVWVFKVLENHMSEVAALSIATLIPLIDTLVHLLKHKKKLDVFAAFMATGFILSIAAVLLGGDGQHISESFSVPGKEHPYRWMGSDLDTKDKFISYIEEIYTPEQAEAYWKKQTENGSIVEIEGKLAQPEADGGSMTGWADAKATLIQDGKGTRSFRFQVPLFDEFEEKTIKLRYVEGKGWRIDEPVDTIR
ncbi:MULTISPECIES: DL-endopeptidase inhibitor IseA family protein [Paenibacillus]|uniref:IseA DL-endopeptidase inhibitor n=1 Tax=Paenibacillus naphthalenovorans TaxID=162209 RepID=A0A0U2KZJ7_9BACL|nr:MULTISPECIES: DL-endopeptidase inhibitor IseA family protein [Paenibacillus]ALS22498.1 IseA DL-endopeptidase inhibitor [Paenibacillus naphthalenovorans]GCL70288.1 hypothetical protein PN4B1_01880 [Paenibacillus naphthalenovorans]SDH86694.1 IseA DL-endopeptidase inhibitor [Paenibacillus naphthalenovorans]